jgi:hypothetical protein
MLVLTPSQLRHLGSLLVGASPSCSRTIPTPLLSVGYVRRTFELEHIFYTAFGDGGTSGSLSLGRSSSRSFRRSN